MGFGELRMLPRSIFGVSANQLSLDQSAVLAGMLKGPEIYNPLYSVENATNRRTVLQNMVAAGYIDQKTADQSAAVDIHGHCWSMPMKAVRGLSLPILF